MRKLICGVIPILAFPLVATKSRCRRYLGSFIRGVLIVGLVLGVVGCATATVHDLKQFDKGAWDAKEVRVCLGKPDKILEPSRQRSITQQVFVYNLRTKPVKTGEVILAICSLGISLIVSKPEKETYSFYFNGYLLSGYRKGLWRPWSIEPGHYKELLGPLGKATLDPKTLRRVRNLIKNGELKIDTETYRRLKEGKNTDRYRITEDGEVELIKTETDQEMSTHPKDKKTDIFIDKQLFEALRNNNPDKAVELSPTAKEFYVTWGWHIDINRDGPPFSLEEAKQSVESIVEEQRRKLVQIRHLCERKGLDWDKAILKKTTQRHSFLNKDERFAPNKPQIGFIALYISDGKTSVALLAKLSCFSDHKDREKARLVYRVYGDLLLDPLTKEERKLVFAWYPGRDKECDKKARNILINRQITKEFIVVWLGIANRHKYGDIDKWIYHDARPGIYEFHFSKEGVVSDVLIREKEEGKKTPPKESK